MQFIHKTDIYDVIQQKLSNADFETALNALSEDGQIYSTYDNDIYSITDWILASGLSSMARSVQEKHS